MKWKEWTEQHWALLAPNGEIVDEIKRDDQFFFVLKSTGKKFVDLKSAKNSRMTGTQDEKRD